MESQSKAQQSLKIKNDSFYSKAKDSQLEQFRKKNTIKVAIIGEKAYWVHDNTFYETSVVDGEINNSDATPINADNLSTKEVRMLMDILDSIS